MEHTVQWGKKALVNGIQYILIDYDERTNFG